MLILVAGDAHIPDRAIGIPAPIQKLLAAGKIQKVVSVGNISDSTSIDFLKALTPETPIITVLGDGDIPDSKIQTSAVFTEGNFKIGVVSGFLVVPTDDIDALAAIARKLDVDILLWGGSHHQDTQNWAGHYFINPGSLTGAVAGWDSDQATENAGFCLLDIEKDLCTVYMYHLDGPSVKVEKAQLPYVARS